MVSRNYFIFNVMCLPFEDKNHKILFEKICKCAIKFPINMSRDAKDLLLRLLDVMPERRITIPNIKKHPFYQKGKENFVKCHPNLLHLVEKEYKGQIGEEARQFIAMLNNYSIPIEDKKKSKSVKKDSEIIAKKILVNNTRESKTLDKVKTKEKKI